jgi:hypothetical protein
MAHRDLDRELKQLLRIRKGTTDILHNRENSRIEFKTSFSLGSLGLYARTMIAFANSRGGFLVFGVEASPHRLRGVDDRFSTVDPARVTSFLREHVSPELEWEFGSFHFHDVELGYLYTSEAVDKPLISTRNQGTSIKEAEIYHRYRAQSTQIRFPELRGIIEARLGRERDAWLKHLRVISRAGPTNVGVLDTLEGKLHGTGATYVIEESLLRKLRFIREGRFTETGGEPTLRLIGRVEPISGVIARREIPVAIHADDLLTAFLAQRELTPEEAKTYLEEATFQPSAFLPLFYFVFRSRLGAEEAEEVLLGTTTSFARTRLRLVRRLRPEEVVGPLGAAPATYSDRLGSDAQEFQQKFALLRTAREERGFLVASLKDSPHFVEQTCRDLPVQRIAEAITHLDRELIRARQTALLSMLLQTFSGKFYSMSPNEKTAFRKAVVFLDHSLFAVELEGGKQPKQGDAADTALRRR